MEFILLPVNKLSNAKSRLSTILSPRERSELVINMVKDVLDAISGRRVVIISKDDLRKKLPEYEFDYIKEETTGLNSAVYCANEHAIKKGADATLFLPGDIPLIKKDHVETLCELGKENPVVISPSNDGGTGALFRSPPDAIDGRFSPTGSFMLHMMEIEVRGLSSFIFNSSAVALDIDTPKDVKEFMKHESETRTYRFLRDKINETR